MSRWLRFVVRALRILVLCLGALGPGAPPPAPAPRRQAEVQVLGEHDDPP